MPDDCDPAEQEKQQDQGAAEGRGPDEKFIFHVPFTGLLSSALMRRIAWFARAAIWPRPSFSVLLEHGHRPFVSEEAENLS